MSDVSSREPDKKTAEMTAPGALAIGSFVGGTYRVLEFIGQGGMGYVYKVEHMMMAKIMALKVLREEQVSSDIWKRFRTEAQAIARLDHPNVVRIYDMSSTESGLPFYTMDLLVGQSLADYLDNCDEMPVERALPVFRQVCAGLSYAHDRGIIHRDIKPGNIMLLQEKEDGPPVVKIVDFGIAKLSALDGSALQGLTRPGEVFGSPLYMSPEQCAGQALDSRTDMYSVGVTMFQVLTGKAPLLGRTAIETTILHQSVVPPSMTELSHNLYGDEGLTFDPALEAIVARLLAKKPDDRYDSLADVARELLAIERGEPALAIDRNSVAPGAVRRPSVGRSTYELSQDQDDEQIETSGPRKSHSLAVVLIAFATLLFFVAMVGLVWQGNKERENRERAHAQKIKDADVGGLDFKGFESSSAPYVKDVHEGYDGDLSASERKVIEAYMASHKGAYSHIETVAGVKSWVFDFPAEFSLGKMDYHAPGLPLVENAELQGRVSMPVLSKIKFEAGESVKAYPQLLRGFNDDQFNWFIIALVDKNKQELFNNLIRQTRMTKVEITSSKINNSDLSSIAKIPALRELNIAATDITGGGLAKSGILPRLNLISMRALTDITPALKVLTTNKHLRDLNLSLCKLSPQDIDLVGQMQPLQVLSLEQMELKDDDLKKLVGLKHLTYLSVVRTRGLTESFLPYLKEMTALTYLKLPIEMDDKSAYKYLKPTHPHLLVGE